MATAAPNRGLLGRLFLRKSVAQVQQETQTSELKRSLGPWNLGCPTPQADALYMRQGYAHTETSFTKVLEG